MPSGWIRHVYETHVGPIPDGAHIHHTCGNGWCVEPTHLEALSPRQHFEAHRYTGLAYGFDETAF